MANYSIERKSYSSLTARVAKNAVRKKISEIRLRGAQAADELMDELLIKSSKNPRNSPLMSRIVSLIDKNRPKWRNFIIELAGRFDAERLSVFGVNLIYGGILTSSTGDTGWASLVHMDNISSDKLYEIVTKGRNRGNLVWILKGRGAFSPETVKICRYFPECAFVLTDSGDMNAVPLSEAKNILVLLQKGNVKGEKELLRSGIPYIFANLSDSDEKGREELYSAPTLSELFR